MLMDPFPPTNTHTHHAQTAALLSAHTAQTCLNLKDPGLQGYAGARFKERKEALDEICDLLPPPEATLVDYSQGPGGRAAAPMSAASFQRLFVQADGGCFGPDGLVLLEGGGSKRVAEIAKGDKVLGGGTVRCVVVYSNATTIRVAGGLEITGRHPIRLGGSAEWVFPFRVATPQVPVVRDLVYNLVLEGAGEVRRSGAP